jgi:hypothetical protein
VVGKQGRLLHRGHLPALDRLPAGCGILRPPA